MLTSSFVDSFHYSGTFKLRSDTDAANQMNNSAGDFIGLGFNAMQGYSGAMLYLKTSRLITGSSPYADFSALHIDFNSNSLQGALVINVGKSSISTSPRTWINCGHVDGYGSMFVVESRYMGDSNAMERTVIKAKLTPKDWFVNRNVISNPSWKTVVYDENSGYIGWQ